MFEFITELTEDDLQKTYNEHKPFYDHFANRKVTVFPVIRAIDNRLDSIRRIINNPDATTHTSYELETLQAEYTALCELHNHYVCNACDFVSGNYYSDCLSAEEPVEEPEEPVEEPEEPVEESKVPVKEYTIHNTASCHVEKHYFTSDLACIQYLKYDCGYSLRHIFDDLIIRRFVYLPVVGYVPRVMFFSEIADCWFDDVPPEVE